MSEQIIYIQDGENTREATAEEVAELKGFQEDAQKIEAEHQAKLAARQSALAKLAALGLTEEEVGAL
jgi:DNA-binding NarL/FixJ family response regulator